MSTTEHRKPVPVPDQASAPFFDGAAEGRLMIRRCKTCGTHMWPVTRWGSTVISRCTSCLSGDVEWVTASGRGTLYTFAVMHQPYDPAFEIPYNLSIVELEEGVRTGTLNIVGCDNDELEIGMPLEVCFEERDGVSLPLFRPVAS